MIFRIAENKKNFTTLPNELLRTQDLGADSLGVLCYLLSHAPYWETTGKHLSAHFRCSKDKITRITKELEAAGYIRRVWKRDENNPKQPRPDWDVADVPNSFDTVQRSTEITESGKTGSGLSGSGKTGNIRSTNKKEILSKKEIISRNPPVGVSESAWRRWWQYKYPTARAPSQSHVTRTTNEFSRLVTAGVTDFDKLVDYTIAKGWQGIGDETYAYTKSLISDDKSIQLMKGIE
tara:strand:- start:756 stop:1460 length:705 start_codon:yes stop_codon:yes gene_type:complete